MSPRATTRWPIHNCKFLGHFIELDHSLAMARRSSSVRANQLSRTPARTTRVAPTVGRDKDFILREILHYDDERVSALENVGALK